MRVRILFLVVLLFSVAIATAQTRRTTLDIYIIDVEGGTAVLFVSPAGESVLIDTGNLRPAPMASVRDAERTLAAAKDAGITKIDHLIITQFHSDHVGGLSELGKLIPIGEFIDHGPNMMPTPDVDA